MKKPLLFAGVLALMSVPLVALALETSDPLEIEIQVSPATLVLDAPQVWVTIHADVKYSDVNTVPGVYLVVDGESIPAKSVFADDRGDLVAKFDKDDVESLLEDSVNYATATVTLVCTLLEDGTICSGSQQVTIRRWTAPSKK